MQYRREYLPIFLIIVQNDLTPWSSFKLHKSWFLCTIDASDTDIIAESTQQIAS